MPRFSNIDLDDSKDSDERGRRLLPKELNDTDMQPDITEGPPISSILDQTPPSKENGYAAQAGDVGVYGISMRGTSHIAREQCCQDYNSFQYLKDEKIWILAIADGVGSCSQSHWGAYTAVTEVIEYLREQLCGRSNALGHARCLSDYTTEEIEGILNEAFSFVREKVEDFADANERPVYDFQSTLTVALYDGNLLYCCHVGDDGIVAEGASGKYLMVTDRIKGEEASSVFTLQSGRWSIRRVNNVVALVMSTDGILDSYVGNAFANNRVYYPFFQKLTYGMKVKPGESLRNAVGTACASAVELLHQKAEEGLSDDMTVLVAANQMLLDRPTRPQFSQEDWDRETEEINHRRSDLLYRSAAQPEKKVSPSSCMQPLVIDVPQTEQKPRLEQKPELKRKRQTVRKPGCTTEWEPGVQQSHQRSEAKRRSERDGSLRNPDPPHIDSNRLRQFIGGFMDFFSAEESDDMLCLRCRYRYDKRMGYKCCPQCGSRLIPESAWRNRKG